MTSTNIPDLKRIRFFNGQRLEAQDLSALQRANRELRWLHNRSLHGWGIGIGLGVAGERGDSAVTVGPGYAVDCMGREIILTEPETLTVPAVAGNADGTPATYYLTVTYQGDDAQDVAESRPGVCAPGGTVRLTEEPLLAWRKPEQIAEGINLILAQASIQNCQLAAPLGLGVRRLARPAQQPYIAAGQTTAGQTVWTIKIEGGQQVGITTLVDTSRARFQVTPAYFAHLMGSRVIPFAAASIPIIALTAISDPKPNSFRFDVYLPSLFAGTGNLPSIDLTQLLEVLDNLGWSVVWMGVEG